MGVLKLFPGLPGVKIHDQLLTVLLGHIDDGVNVAYGAKYGFDAGLGMLGDDGVGFRFVGLI